MATTPISSPVLVGRHDELRRLEALLDDAASGRGRAVVIGGEAGIGKTRLIRELAAAAAARGAAMLVGSAVDFGEGSLPFGAVTEALRPVPRLLGEARLRDLLGPGRADLARVLPDLADAPSAGTDLRDPHAQARLFELLLRALGALAEQAPIVLVLEDLHWADTSTREVFAFLARGIERSRILLVGTYRTDELHRRHPLRPYLTTLTVGRRVEILELERLDAAGLQEQVAAILGRDPDLVFVESLHRRSLGNPFFTEELVSGDVAQGRLSASLRDALLARVEAVAPEHRPVLDALAVLARPSSEGLVAAATGLEPSVVAGALREGMERHVLVRSTGNEPLFAFRHALMQEAIYDELLGTERVRIHRAVGSALATPGLLAGSSNVDAELAFHFRRGRQPELALPAAARAGRDAASRYAYPEALREWEQVLELWEQVGDPETLAGVDHADATAAAAEMASIIGDHRRAVGLIRAALGEVDPASEPVRAARGQAFLMTELFSAGDADGSEVARREALALLERQPPSLEHVAVLNAASYPPLFASRYAEVAELAARALEIAEHHGAVAEAGWAHVPLGTAIAFLGRLDEGRTHIAEALRIARESGQPQALVDAYLADGIVLEAAGRFEDAVSVMEAGLAALRDIGVERTHGTTLRSDMAEALRRLGRWRESLEHVEALLRYERSGWELAHASVLRGHLLAGMGRAEEADEALQTAWEHFGRAGTGFLGHYYAARAENELWRGRPHAALQLAAAGLDEIRATRDLRWIGELTVLAVRALALGGESDGPPAGTAADELLFRLDGDIAAGLTVGTLFVPEVYGYRSLSQAEARRMSGAHDPDAWHDAAARWLALRQPYPRAYAELRAAEAILTAGGDRHAAARSAASAAEAARGLARHPCFGRSRH